MITYLPWLHSIFLLCLRLHWITHVCLKRNLELAQSECILRRFCGNLKWNVDKCLSQRKLGRKEWKKRLNSLPLFYNIYSPSGSCEVLWLRIFLHDTFSSVLFLQLTIMMLLILMLLINLYRPNLALIMQDSLTWRSNSCWPPLVYAPIYECQSLQAPPVPGPAFIGQGQPLDNLGRHLVSDGTIRTQSTTELLRDEH